MHARLHGSTNQQWVIHKLLFKTQTDENDNRRLFCKEKHSEASGVYFHFTSSPLWISPNTAPGPVNIGERAIVLYSVSILPAASYKDEASTVAHRQEISKKNKSLETPPTTVLNGEYAADTNWL